MWTSFCLSIAFFVALLYAPGYLFCRGLRFTPLLAIACAPFPCVAFYASLPVIYGIIGIPCSSPSIVAPMLIAGTALFITGGRKPAVYGPKSNKINWLTFGAYFFAGAIVCYYVFVSAIGDPSSYYCRYDNATHLNLIRAFSDSGYWSSLDTCTYLATGLDNTPYKTPTGFYPSGWADIATLVFSVQHGDLSSTANAFNAVIAGTVFPLSVFAFLKALFPKDNLSVAAGSIVAPAFTAFPWEFFIKGPLSPNMLANALVPAVLGAFIFIMQRDKWSMRSIGETILTGVCAIAALALSQTNALFMCFVFAVPFFAQFGHRKINAWSPNRRKRIIRNSFFFSGLSLAAFGIWAFAYKMPFMREIVKFEPKTDINLDIPNALFNTLSQTFHDVSPAWVMATLSVFGLVMLIASKRTWMVLPASYMMVAYFFSKFCIGLPKRFLSGFWYNDPARLAASASIFMIPLASIALASLIRLLVRATLPLLQETSSRKRIASVLSASVLIIFCTLNYFPAYLINQWEPEGGNVITPFGFTRSKIEYNYSREYEHVYSSEEQAFVRKVLEIIPKGSLVINHPQDGSVFAYGLDGLNTYFRYAASDGYSKKANIIRKRIDKIADDAEVQDAVRSTGAKYLLILDEGSMEKGGVWLPQYNGKRIDTWEGLNGITTSTPGLKLILEEGDMRLYEIEETNEASRAETTG